MCLISKCVCCPVNKKSAVITQWFPSWLLKEWLAVLSLPTVPLQQIILYIKYCKHMGKEASCHHTFPPPLVAFCMISIASIFFLFVVLVRYDHFFKNFLFCMKLHSCQDFGTVPRYASSMWVCDDSWVVRSVLPQNSRWVCLLAHPYSGARVCSGRDILWSEWLRDILGKRFIQFLAKSYMKRSGQNLVSLAQTGSRWSAVILGKSLHLARK